MRLRWYQITSFQFHKGTIRTADTSGTQVAPDIFQFHKGTIRTANYLRDSMSDRHFNSIKVQLEHIAPNTDDGDDTISIP